MAASLACRRPGRKQVACANVGSSLPHVASFCRAQTLLRTWSDRAGAPPGGARAGSPGTGVFRALPGAATAPARLEPWACTMGGGGGGPRRWTWEEFRALPSEEVTADIHCVTKWSKLDTVWQGVQVDTLLDGIDTSARYTLAFCYGGYTTNVPLEDLTEGKAWVAFGYDGEPLHPQHGGPARMLVPHLYFWNSAKWVRGLRLAAVDQPGFWETNGYHNYGDPWREQRYWGD